MGRATDQRLRRAKRRTEAPRCARCMSGQPSRPYSLAARHRIPRSTACTMLIWQRLKPPPPQRRQGGRLTAHTRHECPAQRRRSHPGHHCHRSNIRRPQSRRAHMPKYQWQGHALSPFCRIPSPVYLQWKSAAFAPLPLYLFCRPRIHLVSEAGLMYGNACETRDIDKRQCEGCVMLVRDCEDCDYVESIASGKESIDMGSVRPIRGGELAVGPWSQG